MSLQHEADAACTAEGASTNRHSPGGLAHTQLSYCSGMEKVNSEDASKRACASTHTHTLTDAARHPTTDGKKTKQWSQNDDACEGQPAAMEVMTGTRIHANQAHVFWITSARKKLSLAAWFEFSAAASESLGVWSI